MEKQEIIKNILSKEEMLNESLMTKVESCMDNYINERGFENINWHRGGISKETVQQIRKSSMPFPYFIYDDEGKIVEAYEVVCLSGMASNNGTPDEITVYKVKEDGTKEKFVYSLKREQNYSDKPSILGLLMFALMAIYIIYLLFNGLF